MFFVDFAAAPLFGSSSFRLSLSFYRLASRASWWYLLSASFSEGRARALL